MGRFGRADADTPPRRAVDGRDASSSRSGQGLSRRSRVGAPVGCSNGEKWAESTAPDRRRRCRSRRLGCRGHTLHARHDAGTSVGCAPRGDRCDAGCHAIARLVPIAALCATRPGDGPDRCRGRGRRRDPHVDPWRWEPQRSGGDRRRCLLRSGSEGCPLDVLSVVACAAGAGPLSPRTCHGREQRRRRRRLDHALTRSPSSDTKSGGSSGRPGPVRIGHTSRAVLLSISFQRWPGRRTPTGFCWWPMPFRQRSSTGWSRSGRQTDSTSRSGRVSEGWDRVASAASR